MNPIQFECPHCHEINPGDESLYGQPVTCVKCQATILVPPKPTGPEPQTARLIPGPTGRAPTAPAAPDEETDVFNLSPAWRSFLGPILLGLVLIALGLWLATRKEDFPWAAQTVLVSLAIGVLLQLLVWIKVKSLSYRLTTQRLFVQRGLLAKRSDELELYRVKDVVVEQGILPRVLGYGTITVLANDDTTPQMDLVRISSPTKIKEIIRTQYRAARLREGVRPTEFMRSP